MQFSLLPKMTSLVVNQLQFFYQVRKAYTRKNTAIVCSIMPVFWLAAYSWLGDQYKTEYEKGRTTCIAKDSKIDEFHWNYLTWTLLYLFIPGLILLVLNIAIIVRLQKIRRLFKGAVPGHPLGLSDSELSGRDTVRQSTFSKSVISNDGPSCVVKEAEEPSDDNEEDMETPSLEEKPLPSFQRFSIRSAYQ